MARRWALVLVLVCVGITTAQAPRRTPPRTEVSRTGFPLCIDSKTGRFTGSKLVRSPVLVSPDGRFRAYSENEAVAFEGAAEGTGSCVNTARLFIAGPDSSRFILAEVKTPQYPDALIKGLLLVDWSPDSRYLLSSVFTGTYGSDSGAWEPESFDAWYGISSPDDFPSRAIRGHFRPRCGANVNALGYSKDGQIILRILPDYDEEGGIRAGSCVAKTGVWSLNGKELQGPEQTLTPLPDNYKVQQFGSWLEGTVNPARLEGRQGGAVPEGLTPQP